MKKFLFSFFFIFFILCIAEIGNARVIIDINGKKVKIPEKIDRIVALGPGALRFIVYVHETDKLCGIERIEFKLQQGLKRPYSLVVKKKIENLPVISEGGPGKMPYFEKLSFVSPDIIIGVGFTERQAQLIEKKTGVPVVLLSYGSLGSFNGKFRDSLFILGEIFDKKDKVRDLTDYIVNMESDLKKRTSGIKAVKKVYIGGVAYKGLHDITSTDTNFSPLRWLNVKNVASSLPLKGHVFINWENLIIWNPDYIFIDETSIPLIKKNLNNNRKKYMLLKAFKEKKVYPVLPYNYYNTNVELSLIISYFMGKTIYPEYFSDIDLQTKAEEIIKKFIGLKIKISFPLKNFFLSRYFFNLCISG